jgi:hypothetical protein
LKELLQDLNILNIGVMLQAYYKLKHNSLVDWKTLIDRFLHLSSATYLLSQPNSEDMLDQQILALSLNAISKRLKIEFKNLTH